MPSKVACYSLEVCSWVSNIFERSYSSSLRDENELGQIGLGRIYSVSKLKFWFLD